MITAAVFSATRVLLWQTGATSPAIRRASLRTLVDNDLISAAALFWTLTGWAAAIGFSGWVWLLPFAALDGAQFCFRWHLRRSTGQPDRPDRLLPVAAWANLLHIVTISVQVAILCFVPSEQATVLGVILAVGFSGYAASLAAAFPVLATIDLVLLSLALTLGLAFGSEDEIRALAVLAPFGGIAYWTLM